MGIVVRGLECADRPRRAYPKPEGQGAQGAPEEEVDAFEEGFAPYDSEDDGTLAGQLAGLETINERTNRLLSEIAARSPESRDPMVYDLDWDENARMASWRAAVERTENMPPLLAAAIALLAWEAIDPSATQSLAGEASGRRDPQGSFSHLVASSLCEHRSSRDPPRSPARARSNDKACGHSRRFRGGGEAGDARA